MKQLLEQMNITVTAEQDLKLEKYLCMLSEKNRVMDLTNVPDEEIPMRHFADSLIAVGTGFIANIRSLADVGTGAGFPGLPIAIVMPEVKVTLIDAQEKRCAFLRSVRDELKLENVTVLHMRAEEAGRSPELRGRFDICTARAVAPLNVLAEYLLPLVKKEGAALCWKGPGAADEMEDGRFAANRLNAVLEEPVKMPLPDMQHYLVRFVKKGETPAAYPRKNGLPSKMPLSQHATTNQSEKKTKGKNSR